MAYGYLLKKQLQRYTALCTILYIAYEAAIRHEGEK